MDGGSLRRNLLHHNSLLLLLRTHQLTFNYNLLTDHHNVTTTRTVAPSLEHQNRLDISSRSRATSPQLAAAEELEHLLRQAAAAAAAEADDDVASKAVSSPNLIATVSGWKAPDEGGLKPVVREGEELKKKQKGIDGLSCCRWYRVGCSRWKEDAEEAGVEVEEEEEAGPMPSRRNSFRWLLPRAPQRRLVFKNGECNISRVNINKRGRRYLADIFTTLVDIKWRWNLLIFALAFTLSWVIFGLVWWLICFSHGDMAHHGEDDWKSCVAEVYDFSTALLFSIETQQTIGYGVRFMNPHCPVAIIVVMFQSCFGIIIQALMTGLVFAKLSRPKKRAQTLMFSQNALICERDGQLCFLFRVGDMRKSHIVEAHIRAILVGKRVTREGEVIPLYQRDLQLAEGESECRLFLVWPLIVEHKITSDSPLWEFSADDIHRRQFEILVILEGIVESTGMTTQARTSYLPSEVLWGHRFERLVSYQRDSGQYLIDYSRFNHTVSVEMSSASAKDRAAANRNNNSSDDDTPSEDSATPAAAGGAAAGAKGWAEGAKLLSPGGGTVRGREPSISMIAASRSNVMENVALAAFGLKNEFPNGSEFSLPITEICTFNGQ